MFSGRWLVAGWLVLIAGCSRAPEIPSYQLTGQILVVKHGTNEVLVKLRKQLGRSRNTHDFLLLALAHASGALPTF